MTSASTSYSEAALSDEDRIILAAVNAAAVGNPHRKWIILLTLVAAVLSVLSATALALGVRNISAQNASVACQGSLLENVSAQNAAGESARAQLQTAGLVLADATEAQSADLAALLNPSTAETARKVAAFDFQAQSVLIAQAWHEYVDASKQADQDRDDTPTTFRC